MSMNDRQTAPKAQTMQLSDILYVLFRHKRNDLRHQCGCDYAAVSFYSFPRCSMQSDAKLYIKYVLDNREP
jgi:hypothetical protein